jgi:zinc/manganese transport system substrate-binding protein
LAAARHIRDRLAAVRPGSAAGFNERYSAFEDDLLGRLVGPELAGAMERAELIGLLESGGLEEAVTGRRGLPAIGGWLGAMKEHRGVKFIGDHEVWDAFAARFRLVAAGYLEPAPGLDPTTQHLTDLTNLIRTDSIPLILTCAHVPQRHARFLTEQTPIRLLLLSDQVGEEAEAGDYLSLFDYNIGRITEALRGEAGDSN